MNLTESTRAYIYRVLVAVGAVLAIYGVASGEDLAVWLGLAATVLNLMPAANTSTSPAPRHMLTREDVRHANADAAAEGNDHSLEPYV